MPVFEHVLRPMLLRAMGGDVERVHEFCVQVLSAEDHIPFAHTIIKWLYRYEHPALKRTVAGIPLTGPIGIGAGLIKKPEALPILEDMEFPFLEFGGVTFDEQPGNAKPRMFLLPQDNALINRMGFNNPGAKNIRDRMQKIKKRLRGSMKVFLNVCPSKRVMEEEPRNIRMIARDYAATITLLWPYFDAFVINVSSPNTKNVRSLQEPEVLDSLLSEILAFLPLEFWLSKKPIFLKIAPVPDISPEVRYQIIQICQVYKLAGLVISNTATGRSSLQSPHRNEAGGLSGKPRFFDTKADVKSVRMHMDQLGYKGVIIACGGIGFNSDDSWNVLKEGADLCEAVAAWGYRGFRVLREQQRTITELACAFHHEKFIHGAPLYTK